MVPRFFLCLFLEEKSLSACGIFGYFRVISGLLVAKVLQIFSALYPLYHKGLRLFRQGRLLQIFLDGFLAECPPDLLSSLLLPIFTIIVGINTQRHVHRAVSSQILNLLYVQSSFKKTGDVSVVENMGSYMGFRQLTLNEFPHTTEGRKGHHFFAFQRQNKF